MQSAHGSVLRLRRARAAFDRFDVTYVQKRTRHRFRWYHFLNKPLSMLAALEACSEEVLLWLDADTLVVQEPNGLRLAENEAVGVCAPCNDIIGSTGPDDPRDQWWHELCAVAGVPLEALPMINTHSTNRRIRLYLQAGVFGARRGSGFTEAYFSLSERLLASKVGLNNGPHWLEQIALGLALVAGGFRWREWPWEVNYAVGSFLPDRFARPEFVKAQILHYHDSMMPAYFGGFVDQLRQFDDGQAEWLEMIGPAQDPQRIFSRMVGLPVKLKRKLQRRVHVLRSRNLCQSNQLPQRQAKIAAVVKTVASLG